MPVRLRPFAYAALALALLCVACTSGSGGASNGASGDFSLLSISVSENAVWQINRSIELRFSSAVDFLSVSSNTINIRSDTGVPATGSFAFKRIDTDGDGTAETAVEDTIVFYPSCPIQSDYSDAGLRPGGTTYVLTVAGGENGNTNTIRSAEQRTLATTWMRSFSTPNSTVSSVVFVDQTPGGPIPVTRPKGSSRVANVTYAEIAGSSDPDWNVFFELDATSQTYEAVGGLKKGDALLPLNLYSDEATRAALIVAFNQPVNPSSTNISDRRLRLEFQDSDGAWLPIDTRVELLANCAGSGAMVRLEPIGLLPAATHVRAVILPGFEDIVGDSGSTRYDRFAVAPTAVFDYPTLSTPDVGADEFVESFAFGGDHIRSFQDVDALFDTPSARWNGGELTAAFDFEGTGGPGGDFDWYIRTGENFLFDTTATAIVGGPDGIPTTTLFSTGGVVDVRNLIIERGGTLRLQGQKPVVINATGFVRIDGTLNLSGFSAKNVVTLNSGHQPEAGGVGAAGGGSGGAASTVTTSSTRRGSQGFGPFGEAGTGAFGGESGYSTGGFDNRRPGGGGGGRFADNFDFSERTMGRFAQSGYDGVPQSTSAVTRTKPAKGGQPGLGPFLDNDPTNNYFGVRPIVEIDAMGDVELVELKRGELTRLWAGYGGGGGGDALPGNRFPTPRWTPSSDEKGGGAGAGAGGLRVRALGEIIFGPLGRIEARGGTGGTGENVAGNNHVGGTGGSGSGGHVMLESAVRVDLASAVPGLNPRVHIDVRGGPRTTGLLSGVPNATSWGGGGGPGIIQLHVPSIRPPSDDPLTSNIIVPTESLLDEDPFEQVTSTTALQMIPTFGARSKARSRWIPLGGASFDASGVPRMIEFLFGGVETAPGMNEGKILTTGGRVVELTSLIGPEPIGTATASILADESTLRIEGASLDPLRNGTLGGVSTDLYLRTPALLRNFSIRLADPLESTNALTFDVLSASYDGSTDALDILANEPGVTMAAFVGAASMEVSLIPRFFRVRSGGDPDLVPDGTFVRVTFEGAARDAFGLVDEANLVVPRTADLSRFNAVQPGALEFFRFEVEFDLDAAGTGLSRETEPISLDFVRLPFRF